MRKKRESVKQYTDRCFRLQGAINGMQHELNKMGTVAMHGFEMRLKRLETIVNEMAEVVYEFDNLETPSGLGIDTSGIDYGGRFKAG